MSVMEQHGKSIARLARLLDGLSGGLLVIIGVRALLAAPRL